MGIKWIEIFPFKSWWKCGNNCKYWQRVFLCIQRVSKHTDISWISESIRFRSIISENFANHVEEMFVLNVYITLKEEKSRDKEMGKEKEREREENWNLTNPNNYPNSTLLLYDSLWLEQYIYIYSLVRALQTMWTNETLTVEWDKSCDSNEENILKIGENFELVATNQLLYIYMTKAAQSFFLWLNQMVRQKHTKTETMYIRLHNLNLTKCFEIGRNLTVDVSRSVSFQPILQSEPT